MGIIEQGSFQAYANIRLDEARSEKQPFLFRISMMSFKNLKVYLVFCRSGTM